MSHGQVDLVNYPGFFLILHYIATIYIPYIPLYTLNYSMFSLDTTVFFVLSIEYNFDEKQLFFNFVAHKCNIFNNSSISICHIMSYAYNKAGLYLVWRLLFRANTYY